MADFTPDIAPPGNAWMIGRGAEAPDSLVSKLGGAVGNALDKGMDIFRTSKGNELQASEGEELSSQLRDWASGQSDNILGQKTNPADSDPGLKAAKGEIDLHASAAAQGSPGSKQSLMTRLSEITSRYASQNPYYAPQLQEYAQKVLGFNANAQLLQVASEAEDFKKRLTQGAQEKLVNTAVDAGAGQYNADASLDIPTTMMHGQEILTEQNKAALALQQATLATAQAKPLMTKEQTDDSEFRTVLPVAVKIGEAATNGIWSKFAPMIGRAETGNPVDQPAIAAEVAMAQQNALLQVTKWMDTQNIGEKTRTDILNDVKRRFEPMTAILGGDLSNGKQLTIALNRIKDTYGITFARVAPHVYSAIVIGGPQAAAAMVQNYTSPATTNPNYRQNQTEMSNYFSNPPTFDETMRKSNAFMGGSYSPAAEQDPQKARAVLSTTLPVLDNFSERPHKLDDKEQRVLGNLVGGASAAALGADEPSVLNAATRLTRPGVVQGMIKYAQNPANANDVSEKMSNYGRYLSRAQEVSGRLISQGADTTIAATPETIREGHGLGAISVHYSAAFGPMGATPTFTATDGRGKPVNLTEAQKAVVLRGDPNFGRTLGTFNAARKADETIRMELMKGQTEKPQAQPAKSPKHKSLAQENLDKNNPGNMKVPGKAHEFQSFATMHDGVNAVGHQVALYIGRGLNTIEKIVGKYAPPNENDTNRYIAALSERTGKAPTEEVDEHDIPAIRDAILDQEQGAGFSARMNK